MGKNKNDKREGLTHLPFFQQATTGFKYAEEKEAAKRYGVMRGKIEGTRGDASDKTKRKAQRNRDQFKTYDARFKNAVRKDYDTRRTLEALAQSGDKKAKKWSSEGFEDTGDITEMHMYLKGKHKEMGGNDRYSRSRDYMELTNNAVNKERKYHNQTLTNDIQTKVTAGVKSSIDALRDEMLALNKPQDAADQIDQPSERISSARERVANYEMQMSGEGSPEETVSPFADFGFGTRFGEGQKDATNAGAPDEQEQSVSKAQQLLAKTKSDISDKLRPASGVSLDGL